MWTCIDEDRYGLGVQTRADIKWLITWWNIHCSSSALIVLRLSYIISHRASWCIHIRRYTLTFPKKGTKWCSQRENMSMSFTITISSWSSSNMASFRMSAEKNKPTNNAVKCGFGLEGQLHHLQAVSIYSLSKRRCCCELDTCDTKYNCWFP